MSNRLASAVSPYLRSHADNPVDWFEWGEEAFAEAARRDVPLLVSIGYSTCHWCHVMARESFSDPVLATYLNANFVSIKVDREEHPDVDTSYLAAAGAFTENLGWPLNVFVTAQGRAFFAGTYWAPTGQQPFRGVLEAVVAAWFDRRPEVESNAAKIAEVLGAQQPSNGGVLPPDFGSVVAELMSYEDREHGGFGAAPKFPVAPVVLFLLDRGAAGDQAAGDLATRLLTTLAASELRDPVEGGFFRYSTTNDWSDPHYERMLYDNALLLTAYSRAGSFEVGAGIAAFLIGILQTPGGGFASAQDSESTVDGERVEGRYYALDAAARAAQPPPALDGKVLTGWNGLAIEALATAGFVFDRADWVAAAARAADFLLAEHLRADGTVLRASIDGRASGASATLEDYGMLAVGLLALAVSTGEVRYAVAARALVDVTADGVPGGADPVLVAQGLALASDPSEGAYPSGLSARAGAANSLYLLTGQRAYREQAERAMASVAQLAVRRPISFGAALGVMSALAAPVVQLVVIGPVGSAVRRFRRGIVAVASIQQAKDFASAGFELFAGRTTEATYLCTDFVCALPITDPEQLSQVLASHAPAPTAATPSRPR